MKPSKQVIHLDRISWARAQYGAAKADMDVCKWVAELIYGAVPEHYQEQHRAKKEAKR